MTNIRTEYTPDFLSHPGETLLETLEVKSMTQAELALRMGRPKKTINEIIKGKTSITPETALQLEMALGIPASFWNERERRYQESIAEAQQNKRLEQWVNWLEKVPYKELVQKGWITKQYNPVDILKSVLTFFGVVSPEQWEIIWSERESIAYRKSTAYSADDVSVAAWLRQAELIGISFDCPTYTEDGFRQALKEIRALTHKRPSVDLYQSIIIDLCQQVGVAVAFVPELSQSRVFGASQWLSPQKALIAMSLYYKRDDQFWFTFFHEAAHILLHSKKEVFIDVDSSESRSLEIEKEADQFARDFLIPFDELKHFIQSRTLNREGKPFFHKEDICLFAEQIGIAPSIVVGRLQHDHILDFRFRKELITWLEWSSEGNVSVRQPAEIC
jgi:HTH-type transcriptional regulator/antitoxin HigA